MSLEDTASTILAFGVSQHPLTTKHTHTHLTLTTHQDDLAFTVHIDLLTGRDGLCAWHVLASPHRPTLLDDRRRRPRRAPCRRG